MIEAVKNKIIILPGLAAALIVLVFYIYYQPRAWPAAEDVSKNSEEYIFEYQFEGNDVIEEASAMNESIDPSWWLNSGARLYMSKGTGKTIIGELPQTAGWRKLYEKNFPGATDNGFHPQNIFRLLTRIKADDAEQTVFFNITRIIMSESSLRNESNGVFLFGRYQNGGNFYISGIRTDGMAVIKKKINGVYHTMDIRRFYGDAGYNRISHPNYLPLDMWLGIKSIIKNEPDGSVSLKLFVWDGVSWIEAISVRDNGKNFGGGSFKKDGYAGLRTDFMEVEFDNYVLKKI